MATKKDNVPLMCLGSLYVYSSLKEIASLLNDKGLFVLSIDKNQSEFIDMGTRKLKIYPDNPTDICELISEAKLNLIDQFETEHAYVIVSKKGSF